MQDADSFVPHNERVTPEVIDFLIVLIFSFFLQIQDFDYPTDVISQVGSSNSFSTLDAQDKQSASQNQNPSQITDMVLQIHSVYIKSICAA